CASVSSEAGTSSRSSKVNVSLRTSPVAPSDVTSTTHRPVSAESCSSENVRDPRSPASAITSTLPTRSTYAVSTCTCTRWTVPTGPEPGSTSADPTTDVPVVECRSVATASPTPSAVTSTVTVSESALNATQTVLSSVHEKPVRKNADTPRRTRSALESSLCTG